MDTVITTEQLVKRFGSRTAVHGLDLEVRRGEVFGVIGPNGAGKTTTMRMLLDIVRPTSGSATVLGRNPRTGGAGLRRRIGFLPGELLLEGRANAGELLSHYARISGPVPPRRIPELAERLGLDLSRQIRGLSKGNKQKLGLIQAFMHQPELLVLDEPTSGLDPLVQQEFLAMVREAARAGQTVFLSSHVLSEVEHVADRVAILREGRLLSVSDVPSLRAGAGHHVRAVLADADVAGVRALLEAVPGLRDLAVHADGGGATVTATVDGAVDPLVKSLARCTVTGLVVAEPDLEEAVLSLYGPSTPTAPLPLGQQRSAADRPLTTTGADRVR
ncbi:MAG TPA: ABC transporter ATP-binding protein [Kineosporiaceae bacterium]|nr:ABC transporter ATP-binding protein [Kineosporiaceae bacterium]